MTFKDKLNEYIKKIDCTSKELSEYTYISQSVISRYRRTERNPDDEKLQALAEGISKIAEKKGIADISADKILNDFKSFFEKKSADSKQFISNVNNIIKSLHIHYRPLSEFMNINISFLYRMTNGNRNVKNPEKFADDLCRYILRFHSGTSDIRIISELTGTEVNSQESIYKALYSWLLPGNTDIELQNDTAHTFLSEMDAFDLNEFISGFNFNDSDIPVSPESEKPSPGNYYGIEQFRQAELDFIRLVLMSDSKKPLFMSSNMPMTDMAKDIEFSKKWMMGLAMIMKKGININIIHNLDRPDNEMMLGLISWIPLYMTGQISPYFFRNFRDNTFCYLDYISESAVLTGECVSGFYDRGRYSLTDSAEDISYYQAKSEYILSKTEPLMEIYKSETKEKYQEFYKNDTLKAGKRRNILCSLPLYTISEKLLRQILGHNDLSENEKKKILDYAGKQREKIKIFLDNSTVIDEIPELSEKVFETNPISLFLADIFFEKKICYTYQEYTEHLEMTKKFADKNKNYSIKKLPFSAFKNIQIHVFNKGENVRISKCKSPVIHFVIHHPKLCKSIDNMTVIKETRSQ